MTPFFCRFVWMLRRSLLKQYKILRRTKKFLVPLFSKSGEKNPDSRLKKKESLITNSDSCTIDMMR